jgi:hypothetical protein
MDIGTIVIIVIIVLFYARLYLIRRGKRHREKQEMIQRMKLGKKAPAIPPKDPNMPTFMVKSWWIIVPGVVLMLVGLAIYTQSFLPDFKAYWWVPVGLGGILFIFGFE